MIKKIHKGIRRNGIVENLCMNFYVKYMKKTKMLIIKLNNIVHRQVLVSLSMCVQSVSQISLKAHDETKRLKK